MILTQHPQVGNESQQINFTAQNNALKDTDVALEDTTIAVDSSQVQDIEVHPQQEGAPAQK